MKDGFQTVLALVCLVGGSLAAINRHKRQVAALCPSGDGRFPIEGNCRQFMECEDGIAEVKSCPDRLVFSPQTMRCARAGTVNGCTNQGNPSDSLCDVNPGDPGESWKVAHPQFCNAFYTCESHYIHRRCEFCGEGLFFSQDSGMCEGFTSDIAPHECSIKQLVPHSQKSVLSVYPDCNLFQNNPFSRLLARIESQNGGYSPVQVQGQTQNSGQPVVLLNPVPSHNQAYYWNK